MHLSEGDGGGTVFLKPGMWRAAPETGLITLTPQALNTILNTDPIEKWYILDPEPIARGRFASVHQCRHRVTGEQFAAKVATRCRLGVDATTDIIHEIAVNAILAPCAKTVKLRDVFTTDTAFILIMEYAVGGDMQTLIEENVVPYERHVIVFVRQLLEGLAFMHDRSLVHLDIKPQNLVLMGEYPDCTVKVCDFDTTRQLTPGYQVREILGTQDYVAPEILHYEPITTRADMWSLGVLTYVLLTGFLPFDGDNDLETYMQISRADVDFPKELFEDITPEAIDFMKKLLIREPAKRMSAHQCLGHQWMKKPITRPNPPTTLNLPSPIVHPLPSSDSQDESVAESTTKISSCFSEKHDSIDASAEKSFTEPQNIGRPPLHPRSSQKSLDTPTDETPCLLTPGLLTPAADVVPLPATTPFLNKESRIGSRHNLNRIRGMSKSREVLSERVQMSNLKKTLSKSRERLFDPRLGLSTSRKDLMSIKNLSQSVEALSALSQLQQNGALYRSCNNIFIPMIHLINKEGNMHDRMYKSLASISTIHTCDSSKKIGYFESRFSTNGDYNDIITQQNTTFNMAIGDAPCEASMRLMGGEDSIRGNIGRNTCKGGRDAERCSKICYRHNHKQSEAQLAMKINKLSRTERLIKDGQRKRKERKESEIREKGKQRKTCITNSTDNIRLVKQNEKPTSDGSLSPTNRRGSVCHVEQRLQERHERQLAKQEKEERKLSINGNKKNSSIDLDRSPVYEKMKSNTKLMTLSVNNERPRSITPTRRRRSTTNSPKGSDVSEASSMESVNGSLDNIVLPRSQVQTKKCKQRISGPELGFSNERKNSSGNEKYKKERRCSLISKVTKCPTTDEAHISLDERAKEVDILDKSDCGDSAESDQTYTGIDVDGAATPTECNQNTSIDNQNYSDKNVSTITVEPVNISDVKINKDKITTLYEIPELSSIQEETVPPKYTRSTSNSRVNYFIGEESKDEVSQEPKSTLSASDLKDSENKRRTRSLSVEPNSSCLVIPCARNRSNSVVHHPSQDKSRPWGEVCSGAVARAIKNFTLQEDRHKINEQTENI